MLRHQRTVGLVVLVAGLVWGGIAQAQPGGGRRGGGFGGGMGGPGMGGPLMLAGNPAVQKEIGLEGDDAAKVQKIVESFREEMRSEMDEAGLGFGGPGGGPGAFEGLKPEEREAKMREMNEKRMGITKKLNDKFMPQLKESLSPSQFERLQQIQWQAGGSQALAGPELGKALDLSKEQRDKIGAINRDYDEKRREMFAPGAGGGPPDFQAMFAKMQDLNKERDGKATEVLSKEQQEKYAKLKGKPFDVALLMQGGPGGRGGPGGPGGPGGRPPAGAAGRPQKKDADKKE